MSPAHSTHLRTLVLLTLGLLSAACGSTPIAEGSPYGAHTNRASSGLALEGYDPVSYFEAGESAPQRGRKALEVNFEGSRYRFATAEHQELFLGNPERYVPAYGGWCAWAMVDGEKVDVDPESYVIQDERLMLFYDGLFGDTRKSWNRGEVQQLAREADQRWSSVAGPRAVRASQKPELALGGMDPLTFGLESQPRPGSPSHATLWGGQRFQFESAAHRAQFLTDPELYVGMAAPQPEAQR